MSLSFPYRYDGSRRSPTFEPFSHHLWDPFDGVTFSSSPSLASLMSFQRQKETSSFAFVSTRVDWKETPEAHVFMADLPGVKKEEIKLRVEEGRVLHISGERSRLHKEKTDTWHCVERSFGRFKRRLWIPENGKMDQVKAAMEDGVLTVTVPKEEAKEVEVKSIEITD